jgi:hypothetical protein
VNKIAKHRQIIKTLEELELLSTEQLKVPWIKDSDTTKEFNRRRMKKALLEE